MTKVDYITEMLSDALPMDITLDNIRELAKNIIDGLDIWYELSGDSIATSNRYASLESEKSQAVKKAEKDLRKTEEKYEEQIAEMKRIMRRERQQFQQEIEELRR